jgi:hypothetical protein
VKWTGQHAVPASDAFGGVVGYRTIVGFGNASYETGRNTSRIEAVHTAFAGEATVAHLHYAQQAIGREPIVACGPDDLGMIRICPIGLNASCNAALTGRTFRYIYQDCEH